MKLWLLVGFGHCQDNGGTNESNFGELIPLSCGVPGIVPTTKFTFIDVLVYVNDPLRGWGSSDL